MFEASSSGLLYSVVVVAVAVDDLASSSLFFLLRSRMPVMMAAIMMTNKGTTTPIAAFALVERCSFSAGDAVEKGYAVGGITVEPRDVAKELNMVFVEPRDVATVLEGGRSEAFQYMGIIGAVMETCMMVPKSSVITMGVPDDVVSTKD